jgi:hypothetical protein
MVPWIVLVVTMGVIIAVLKLLGRDYVTTIAVFLTSGCTCGHQSGALSLEITSDSWTPVKRHKIKIAKYF